MNPEELDEALEQLYAAAQLASGEGLKEEALKKVQEALDLLEAHGEESERHSFIDFMMLMGDICWAAGDYEGAYQSYHKVEQAEPERHDARAAMGVSLYHLCRFTAAQVILEMCTLDEPDDAEAWYYLGLLNLRLGKHEVAYKHFAMAHELQENNFLLPVEMPEEEIISIAEAIFDELPESIRDALENVPIILQARPEEELLYSCDPPMDPTVLGIFDGVPLPERDSTYQETTPTRIVLFYENIWLVAGDRTTLEEELWVTMKHEIGHFFGLSEEELAERGLD